MHLSAYLKRFLIGVLLGIQLEEMFVVLNWADFKAARIKIHFPLSVFGEA